MSVYTMFLRPNLASLTKLREGSFNDNDSINEHVKDVTSSSKGCREQVIFVLKGLVKDMGHWSKRLETLLDANKSLPNNQMSLYHSAYLQLLVALDEMKVFADEAEEQTVIGYDEYEQNKTSGGGNGVPRSSSSESVDLMDMD